MTRSRSRAVAQPHRERPEARIPAPVSSARPEARGRRPGWFRLWWRAVRPFSFTASMTPVLVGSAVAFGEKRFHPGLFAAAFIASIAIHAGANLVNDYYDHVRGVDTPESIGPGGMIQRGLLTPHTVLRGALVLFALSAIVGLILVASRGWPILVIGALSVSAGYAYTGGPVPLGYVGLGDAVVFFFMGVVTTTGAYYVQTAAISRTVLWAAVPVAALVDAILVVNNLRDLDGDRARGKRTLATLIGRAATRTHFLILVVAAYVSIALGIWLRTVPPLAGLAVVTIPDAARIWRVIRAETDPQILTVKGIRATAQLHQRIGLLLALAFVAVRLK